ncbi:MAG: DnaD domain protein [Oscillospiraceae bacterium]|nr:DnaD domain protein [Oscillospiraceae bacterium]
MRFKVDSGLWGEVFAVPGAIVDKHIKLCGAVSLKVILLALRHGGEASARDIASFLNLPLADVLDAVNYWIHLGVLCPSEKEEAFAPAALLPFPAKGAEEPLSLPAFKGNIREPAVEEPLESPERTPPAQMPGESRKKLTPRQIGDLSRQDESVACLLQEAQAVLGSPLTPVSTDTIAALYSYYGMKPDLILMLLGYCASIGKVSMRYIEKVAAGWIEQGIDSHEKAECEIVRAQQRHDAEHKIRRMMGITDRALIAKEREFISQWTGEWKCRDDLIRLAYERCIEQKGKVSFAYMGGILQSWREKDISTPAQAVEDMKAGKPKKQIAETASKASYDLGELENLTYEELVSV